MQNANSLSGIGSLLIGLLLYLFAASPLWGASDPRLQEANRRYELGDYQAAAERYEDMLREGAYSYSLFYNLGNAYFQLGDWGRARWNYERAALLQPMSADLRHNLQVLRDEAGLPPELPTFVLLRWWSAFNSWVGSGTGGYIGLVLTWLGALGLGCRLVGIRLFRGLRTGAAAALLLGLLLAFSAWVYNNKISRPSYLVILENTLLHRSPDRNTPVLTELEAGARLLLKERWKNWRKVQLLNGETGWVPEQVAGEVGVEG